MKKQLLSLAAFESMNDETLLMVTYGGVAKGSEDHDTSTSYDSSTSYDTSTSYDKSDSHD